MGNPVGKMGGCAVGRQHSSLIRSYRISTTVRWGFELLILSRPIEHFSMVSALLDSALLVGSSQLLGENSL